MKTDTVFMGDYHINL